MKIQVVGTTLGTHMGAAEKNALPVEAKWTISHRISQVRYFLPFVTLRARRCCVDPLLTMKGSFHRLEVNIFSISMEQRRHVDEVSLSRVHRPASVVGARMLADSVGTHGVGFSQLPAFKLPGT